MATTKNQYTGDGSTVLFPFTFPYIEESDVVVSIDGVVQTITTEYVFSNATTIGINTAPATGAVVLISRQTSAEDLKATFFPGSAIRARDLNDNFTQNLYTTQEAEASSIEATTAATNAATSAANAASDAATAAAGVATAQAAATSASTSATNAASDAAAALTSANNAVSTANTASTDATNAVNTANTASTNIDAAVNTANAAATDAATAITTANSATTTANSAVTTANSAVTTANSADAKADTAIATANASTATASGAESTANQAAADATAAVTNAQTALDAVGNVLDYTIVSSVADIPGTPSDAEAVQVADSTGIESLTPLTGLPSGFVGDSGIFVRIVYRLSSSSWEFISYSANDADVRYVRRGDNVSELINDSNFIDASGAPVQSVNGLTGDVTITLTNSLNDLTDVDTASTGHVPTDGQGLVWNEGHSHWMPGDAAANIVDQGDFAYEPVSNTLVWASGTNVVGQTVLDPDDWKFSGQYFIWSPYSSNHSEMMKLQVGDSIDYVLGAFTGTRTVTTAPTINGYDGPSGVNSGPTSYSIEVDLSWPADSSDELRLTCTRFVQGIEPLRTGDVLVYDVPTSKWTASPTSKLDLNFENLSDFAYGPTSNQVELEGPLKANGSSITGEEFIAATAVLYFASTNTRVFDALATLAVDEAVTIYYYGLLGNGEERLITFNTTVRIPVAVQGDNAAIYWNFDYGGTYINPDGSTGTVTTIPSRGPILITSPYLVNGTDALNNGDILKYNHTTGKWTASPSISISTLPLLP